MQKIKNTSSVSFEPYEQRLHASGVQYVAGIDEAGRGPLAGPVIAAAVVFARDTIIKGVNDSKKLTATKREHLYEIIRQRALSIGIGRCSADLIDEINILQATYRAMKQAVANLDLPVDHLLIDGRSAPQFDVPYTTIVKGDSCCHSIAAASIIAKVTRDRLMREYDSDYPCYGFAKHKGYGTRQHIEAIKQFGRCPIHRKSFVIHSLEK